MAKASEKTVAATRITCAAGKGEMDMQECLDCALAHENTCGYDYPLLKAIYRNNHREGIHVTDLTGCLRRAWYSRMRKKAPGPQDLLIVTLGNAVHEYLEGSDEYIQCELPVEALGLKGTIDVYMPQHKRIVDFKTTRWMSPSKLPYGSHELQVNIYAQMLRETGQEVEELFIQYIDLSGPTKCRKCSLAVTVSPEGHLACPACGNVPKDPHLGAVVLEVPVYPEFQIKDIILERREKLESALTVGMEPDREESFLCRYCDHAKECLG